MSTAQTIEIYKILSRHFKNEEEATIVVRDIEQIIDHRFEEKKDLLATKEDILRSENRLENKLNDQLKWTMATIIAMGGLVIAAIKLL